jgi:hypothetical protein
MYGSGSRSSLAALRHALHNYQSYSESPGARHPPRCSCIPDNHQDDCDVSTDVPDCEQDWDPEVYGRIAGDPMEALIDIHRVLYRGMDDPSAKSPEWAEQGKEVKRVVEQWFEGDCGE